MGLTAGPVPARVSPGVKAGLLDLIDHAREEGWSVRSACGVLEMNPDRAWRWRRHRRRGADLADHRPGPTEALHGILGWERQAIIDIFEEWGEIDRSHRKLAHRGSRLERVFVSESTVFRVLSAENLMLPALRKREPVGPRRPWPRVCAAWCFVAEMPNPLFQEPVDQSPQEFTVDGRSNGAHHLHPTNPSSGWNTGPVRCGATTSPRSEEWAVML